MKLENKIVRLTPLKAVLGEFRLPIHLVHLASKLPFLLRRKTGKGQPIYVLPGYLTSDRSTVILRRFLSWHGYTVYGWGLGVNRGGSIDLIQKIASQLKNIFKESGRPITLIGWSLGGFLAREVARDFPELVAQVITLGSPSLGGPEHTAFDRQQPKPAKTKSRSSAIMNQRSKIPITVPIISIYSKSDKVVAWQASCDKDKRHKVAHFEVNSSHAGLGFHPNVYKIILEALLNEALL